MSTAESNDTECPWMTMQERIFNATTAGDATEATTATTRMSHRTYDWPTIAHGASAQTEVGPRGIGEQNEGKNGVVGKLWTEQGGKESKHNSSYEDGDDDGYHGPFFGFRLWRKLTHRWGFSGFLQKARKQREPSGYLGTYVTLAMEIVGAVLTPLSATLDGTVRMRTMLGQSPSEMESYVWRPPWFEEDIDGDGRLVMMLGRVRLEKESYIWRPPWFEQAGNLQAGDRQFLVERDKRKPPW